METIEITELTDLQEQVNLLGILVSCQPDGLSSVKHTLSQLPGVEIHGQNEHSQLVVTIEDPDGRQALLNRYETINATPGILATALVFSHSDDGLEN